MSHRKLDVEGGNNSGDEEFDDELAGTQGPDVATILANIDGRVREISSLTVRGDLPGALAKALVDPPYGTAAELEPAKENFARAVVDALTSAKAAEVTGLLGRLNADQVQVLLKYVYRGMALSSSASISSSLLAWHEKIIETTSVGSVCRVIADRRQV